MVEHKALTGYPSIDKPWLKYYSNEEKSMVIPEGSMYDYLYEKNKDYPNDIALIYYGHKYTYNKLFELIDRCCRNLSELGVKRGDIVTIQAISLPQVIVLIYALTRIGACGNMLYPDAKADEVISSMKKTNSHLLVVVDVLLSSYENDLPSSFDDKIILLNITDEMSFVPRQIARRKATYKHKNPKSNIITWKEFIGSDGNNYEECHDSMIPAFMLRTGGTTGIPKEVVLSSRCFNAGAEEIYWAPMCPRWKRQKTNILLLPPFIAFGIASGIHNALSYGVKTVISLEISPEAVTKQFLKHKPNYIIAGTVQIEQLMKDLITKPVNMSYIQMLCVGGESMNQSFEKNLRSFLIEHHCNAIPFKGYGLTETAATVTMETLQANKIGSVGIPLALCNMKIIDPETGKELTYNTPGEICLSSPGIMMEYYNNREATEDLIEVIAGEKWLHTGDIGIITEDGMLTITGRIKRIIVCKEGVIYHKVFPQLIEDKLTIIDGVLEICIVGQPNEEAGNIPVAFVVPNDKENFNQVKKALIEYCSANLEKYESPTHYYYMTKLPRTLIGKVDYLVLEKLAEEQING